MREAKHLKWLMATERMAEMFSTCSKKQYSCFVLESGTGRVVGFGYNGSPPSHPHCSDGHCPRFNESSASGSSYDNCIANHAEANALLWSNFSAGGEYTLIVNGPPCFSCCKLISSTPVKTIVHLRDSSYLQYPVCLDFLATSGISVISYSREDLKR